MVADYIEVIYFSKIYHNNKKECYELIENQLSYILDSYKYPRIHIILICESIEVLECFGYLINNLIRKGNGIGSKVSNISYTLELCKLSDDISNQNNIYFTKIKDIVENEENNEKIYLFIDSNFEKYVNNFQEKIIYNWDFKKKLNIYLNYICEIKTYFNENNINIAGVDDNYFKSSNLDMFFINKKYFDTETNYYKLEDINRVIHKLNFEKSFNTTQKHSCFYDKYNISFYENSDKNSTKLNYDNKKNIEINLNFKPVKNIDHINSFILIIDFPRLGGGTTYFLKTIIEKYKYNQTLVIIRNINNMIHISINDEYMLEKNYTHEEYFLFINNNIDKIIKIFVNHIINHSEMLIDHLFTLKKETTYITHDYYMLFTTPQPTYESIKKNLYIRNKLYIDKFDQIITQNITNLFIFDKYLNKRQKLIVTELPDYTNSLKLYKTQNEKIIVGVVGDISDIKGRPFITDLNNHIKNNNLNIEIIVFGSLPDIDLTQNKYSNIEEFNNLLIKYKPNLLLECSIWPETYSYTLTMMMRTQLPILFKRKSFELVVNNRLENYAKSFIFNDLNDCIKQIYYNKQDYFYTISPIIYFNPFWDNYFITKKEKSIPIGITKYDIKPYFIYFPQFHDIEENNTRFYNGYNDISNLHILQNKINNNEIEIPWFEEIGINQLNEYNLTNNKIIQKHIDIAEDYNIAGFAIYYYWFSSNTITNKNTIMSNVIDQFFTNNINIKNKKIFFIWANENWTKNAAFGEDICDISNKYDIENIHKNVNNLINYFKHDNYLKIDNKPVFFIYHPFLMTDHQIDLLYEVLNNVCILNSFSGVNLVLNSFFKTYQKYKNFYINFNYKNDTYYIKKINNQRFLDYDNYINCIDNNKQCIQTIVFDFDNRARLVKPDRTNLSSICINNTEFNKLSFTDTIIETYNKSESGIDKIMLINAFNEWGEKMTFEPSKQYKYYNLNLLTSQLNIKQRKNIVLITSKIVVSKNPFSYSKIRSIYSTDERYKQTFETINSIREKIPDSFIVLLDNSILEKDLISKLENCVDKFINIIDDDILNYYTNECKFKAFGDIYQQIKFFDTFLKYIDTSNIINFYKISGRYLINDNFNYQLYDNDYSVIKKNQLVLDREYYYTCFYKISKYTLFNYFSELKNIIQNKEKYEGQDCEMIIGNLLIKHHNIKQIDTLGITQRIAIVNEIITAHNENNI
jgi:hypothetical protein